MEKIVVGCDDYTPFSYMNVNGNQTRIDVELATEAFHRMGYEADFTFINWEEKKDLLKDGTIEVKSKEGVGSSFIITLPFEVAEQTVQAVDLFANNPPATFNAILMDIMMPVMDAHLVKPLDVKKAIDIICKLVGRKQFDESCGNSEIMLKYGINKSSGKEHSI